MTPEEFVRAVEVSVRDSAIKSTMKNLSTPPAESRQPELSKVRQWFQTMSAEEKEMAKKNGTGCAGKAGEVQ